MYRDDLGAVVRFGGVGLLLVVVFFAALAGCWWIDRQRFDACVTATGSVRYCTMEHAFGSH